MEKREAQFSQASTRNSKLINSETFYNSISNIAHPANRSNLQKFADLRISLIFAKFSPAVDGFFLVPSSTDFKRYVNR